MYPKKVLSVLLAAVVFLSAACGKANVSEQAQWSREDRLMEYLPMEQGDMTYTDITITNGQIAYQYSEADASGTVVSGISFCSLIDKAVRNCPLSVRPGDGLIKYTADENGGIYAVLNSRSESGFRGEGGGQEYFLAAFDSDGKERFRQNVTAQIGENNPVSVGGISVDGQGRLYVSGSSYIWLYSADGAYCGTIDLDGRNYASFRFAGTDRAGGMYIAGYGGAGYELAEIDYDTKSIGAVYGNFKIGGGACVFGKGIEKDFLVSDGDFVYEYDLQSRSLVKLFQWMDFDIDGTGVQGLGAAGGIVAAVGRDDASGESFLVRLSDRQTAAGDEAPSEAPSNGASDSPLEKQELVLATLSLKNDPFLKAAVVAFNKASETCHITIREYGHPSKEKGERYERWTMNEWSDAVARLNADLVSENCPDIVDLTDINIGELAQKEVFLDLGPFLDSSSVLSRGDYLSNILEACTYQERLLGIPKYFSVTSVMAHASDVGTEQGWTLEELMAYAAAHPDAELFENATRAEIMNYCMSFYESHFIDQTNGECSFDSPEFRELLEFVKGFPDETGKAVGEFVSPPVKISNRDVLLEKITLSGFHDIQYHNAVFENDGILIGFPTPDKTPGHALKLSSVYAVTSRSAAAESAWEFIEEYLAAAHDTNGGFPSDRQELQESADRLIYVEYMKDSKGNPVLDENGEPIPATGAGGTVSWTDGWSYDYHHETPEEVEQVLTLLNAARRSDTFNGNGVIMLIIGEEAEFFYNGQKSVIETAEMIRRRIQVYLDENS